VKPALEVRNVSKSYGVKQAVDDVSLSVPQGEIFGLLGPNGAGKTSLIRMAMDILRPDSGEILLLGEPIGPSTQQRIGYLPEDRGLYQRQKVRDTLRFLGEIKGLPGHIALRRAEKYLDRVGLLDVLNKKMRELSKGMQQKVQIAAVLLHEPDLIVMDEPFSGLDPVNRRLIIEVMKETAEEGATIILSTHLIDQVESLCREVFLINQGKGILQGEVRKVKESHADNSVLIEVIGNLPEHPGIERMKPHDGMIRVWLRTGVTPEKFLDDIIQGGIQIRHFERALPSLDEIFVRAVS
jgi:ABC-2 type transport system ATP-binding protein